MNNLQGGKRNFLYEITYCAFNKGQNAVANPPFGDSVYRILCKCDMKHKFHETNPS